MAATAVVSAVLLAATVAPAGAGTLTITVSDAALVADAPAVPGTSVRSFHAELRKGLRALTGS